MNEEDGFSNEAHVKSVASGFFFKAKGLIVLLFHGLGTHHKLQSFPS